MDVGSVIGALGSILSGGVTGVVGAGLTRYADYKLEALRMEHKREEQKLENEQIRLEGEVRSNVARVEAEGATEVASYSALSASYQADTASYLAQAKGKVSSFFMGTVDWVRGMTRPAITAYLIALTTWISYALYDMMMRLDLAVFSEGQLFTLWSDVVNMVLYLTATSALWWFGSRPKARVF